MRDSQKLMTTNLDEQLKKHGTGFDDDDYFEF